MSLIKIRNLNVTYKVGYKNVCALKKINVNIDEGEYVCIIGNNGTGKSSLIKSVLGLLPISSGSVILNCGKDSVSYVPQINTMPTDFPATIYELVLSGTQKSGRSLPFYKKDDKVAADNAMDKTGILNLKKRRFCELSGGQQQRVLLSRALAKKPKVLVLDEPCAGLDEKTTENFYKLLYELNKQNNTTIIMISHDLTSVEKYATRVIKLENEVLFDGSVDLWIKKRNAGECI